MALSLKVHVRAVVFVGDTKIKLMEAYEKYGVVTLENGDRVTIYPERAVEIIPQVMLSYLPLPNTEMYRLVFEAPIHIRITREERMKVDNHAMRQLKDLDMHKSSALRMVMLSVPFCHIDGNRRCDEYVMRIKDGVLLSIKEI